MTAGGASGEESACNAEDTRDSGLIPGWKRSPGGGNRQPTPVFLPGDSQGQRSLGRSPRGHKELNVTKAT